MKRKSSSNASARSPESQTSSWKRTFNRKGKSRQAVLPKKSHEKLHCTFITSFIQSSKELEGLIAQSPAPVFQTTCSPHKQISALSDLVPDILQTSPSTLVQILQRHFAVKILQRPLKDLSNTRCTPWSIRTLLSKSSIHLEPDSSWDIQSLLIVSSKGKAPPGSSIAKQVERQCSEAIPSP